MGKIIANGGKLFRLATKSDIGFSWCHFFEESLSSCGERKPKFEGRLTAIEHSPYTGRLSYRHGMYDETDYAYVEVTGQDFYSRSELLEILAKSICLAVTMSEYDNMGYSSDSTIELAKAITKAHWKDRLRMAELMLEVSKALGE